MCRSCIGPNNLCVFIENIFKGRNKIEYPNSKGCQIKRFTVLKKLPILNTDVIHVRIDFYIGNIKKDLNPYFNGINNVFVLPSFD